MKLLFISSLLLSCFMLLRSQVITLDVGEVTLPKGFVHKRTGMTDSLMGEISSSDGALVISYDIGPMAGIHMHPQKRNECSWFQEKIINGRKVYLGLIEKQGKRELIVTIMMDEGSEPLTLPANFRATVRNKRDIADLKKIAASYKPKQKSKAQALRLTSHLARPLDSIKHDGAAPLIIGSLIIDSPPHLARINGSGNHDSVARIIFQYNRRDWKPASTSL